jgi:endonuclease YncB( thermonuclease family)
MGGRALIAFTGNFWLVGMLLGMLAWPCAPARAQRLVAAPSACKTEAFGTGRVTAVVDGRSFILDDGREIRVAGIEVVQMPAPGESGPRAQAAAAAARSSRAALETTVGGQIVELRRAAGQASANVDRYGRTLAAVFVERDGTSVAHALLAGGFAKVSANVGDRACAAELLGKERSARERRLGVWGEAYYAVVGAESGAALEAEHGRFTVVEGKVLSVRESAGTIYMNFGRRWSEALTVTVLKRNERSFAAGGLDLKKLTNRRVRVRGWIEERNGPRIEATRPEQIEIAERN